MKAGPGLVLGIDASTTACKAIVFDATGQVCAVGRGRIDLHNPSPGAWEQSAEDWWDALGGACRQLARDIDVGRLGALCIAQQRETFVLTDAHARPLRPALCWMDNRCTAEVDAAVAALGADALHEISGKPPCTTPTMYKLMYVLGHEPALAAAGPIVCDVHAFLAWRLTGRRATSLASADPTGLIDMQARCWSSELLQHVGISPEQLPELVSPGELLGRVTAEAAERTGLPVGLPVVAGAGDGQCAGLGAGIVGPGRAYLNLGTAIVSGVLSARYHCDRAFRTLYGALPETFFLETDLQGGTFTVTWLVDHVLRRGQEGMATSEEVLADLHRGAAPLGPGSGGLMMVPYFNGVMNPYWDDAAAGLFVGLTGSHGPAHLYRAILEGVAFEQRLHLHGVEQATGLVDELVLVGGGSKSDLWCQILADVLGRRVVRAGTPEATALGAGMIAAAHALGFTDVAAAATAMSSTGEAFDPGPDHSRYVALYGEVYEGLYPLVAERVRALRRLTTRG